jgi:hypothetical protein
VEVIDPGEIADARPRWEDVTVARELEQRLRRERAELLRFQERVDAARERLDDTDLTQRELEELKGDLERSAPDAVRRQMPGFARGSGPAPADEFDAVSGSAPTSTIPARSLDQLVPH